MTDLSPPLTAYVVLNRPDEAKRDHCVLYVAAFASREAAIGAVRSKFNPAGELEINGLPSQKATMKALRLKPGEVRLL